MLLIVLTFNVYQVTVSVVYHCRLLLRHKCQQSVMKRDKPQRHTQQTYYKLEN